MILKLWRLLRPFHKVFWIYAGLIVVFEFAQILSSYTISGAVTLFGRKTPFAGWLLYLAALAVLDEIILRLDTNIDWRIINQMTFPVFKYLKTKAVEKFLRMDMSWHHEQSSGVLISKVQTGVDRVRSVVDHVCWEFFPTATQAILSVVPLLFLSPWTVLIAAIALVIFTRQSICGERFRKPLREARHDLLETEAEVGTEYVRSVETATVFGQEDRMMNSYRELHDEIAALGNKEVHRAIFYYGRWRIRVLSWSRRLILALWLWQLNNGTLDVAGLIFVGVLTDKLFMSFWRFAKLVERVFESGEAVLRLEKLLAQQPRIVEPLGASVTLPVGASIEFRDVSFSYHNGTTVLKNLSLNIRAGEIVAVVGPTGSGKTTLRRLLPRLYEVRAGQVLIGNIDVRSWPLAMLRSLFAYVPQGDDVYIYNDTLANNIRFARPDATAEEVARAAGLANIHNDIADIGMFPDGYETSVGERGVKLSGGQKQRIALARAILADRPIIILDEATNALDAVTEREIQEQLRTVFAGRTVVIIAHRLATIWNVADRIIVLDDGRKVEEGTHAELMAASGLYAKMVNLQNTSST